MPSRTCTPLDDTRLEGRHSSESIRRGTGSSGTVPPPPEWANVSRDREVSDRALHTLLELRRLRVRGACVEARGTPVAEVRLLEHLIPRVRGDIAVERSPFTLSCLLRSICRNFEQVKTKLSIWPSRRGPVSVPAPDNTLLATTERLTKSPVLRADLRVRRWSTGSCPLPAVESFSTAMLGCDDEAWQEGDQTGALSSSPRSRKRRW